MILKTWITFLRFLMKRHFKKNVEVTFFWIFKERKNVYWSYGRAHIASGMKWRESYTACSLGLVIPSE